MKKKKKRGNGKPGGYLSKEEYLKIKKKNLEQKDMIKFGLLGSKLQKKINKLRKKKRFGNRRPDGDIQKEEYLKEIKKEKTYLIRYGILGLKSKKKKEKLEYERIKKLKVNIEQKFPRLEKLFENDDYFSKLVCKLISNMHLISTNKSKVHTIRTLRTTARNHQQSELRKRIIEYAKKNKINPEKTEQWLFMREML